MSHIHKYVNIRFAFLVVLMASMAWSGTIQAQNVAELERFKSTLNAQQLEQLNIIETNTPEVLSEFNQNELRVIASYMAGERIDRSANNVEIIDRLFALMPSTGNPSASILGDDALLSEDFNDETFPPTGWNVFKLEGDGTTDWMRVTAQSNSAPASARRLFGGQNDGFQESWLVSPQIAINSDSYVLEFFDRTQWPGDYGFSGVFVSTGSGDPAEGDFTLIFEIDPLPANIWRSNTLDLSDFDGETVYLGFRYAGDFAHTWWIDDVLVYEPAAQPNPVTLNSPSNEATNVSVNTTLTWSAGSGSTPTEYDVYFGTDPDPAFAGTVTETSWATPVLDFETTYYWNVVAKNEAGSADASGTWSFTTQADPTLSPPFTVDFSSFPPLNWERPYGLLTENTEFTEPAASNWLGGTFNNQTGNDLATRINLWINSTGTAPIARWFMSPVIDMGDGSVDYELLFDVAVTVWASGPQANPTPAQLGPDDYFAVVASLDGGATWSSDNVLFELSGAEGDEVAAGGQTVTVSLAGVTGEAKIAFYAQRDLGPTQTTPDIHLHVGNVRMRVASESPVLVVDTEELDFGTIFAGDTTDLTVLVSNEGGAPMIVTADSDSPDFLVDDSPVEIAPNSSYMYTITFAPGMAGELSGAITFTAGVAGTLVAPGIEGSPATVSVEGIAVDPPVAGVAPESFNVSTVTGNPNVTRTLTISNTGGADLEFALGISYAGMDNKLDRVVQTFTTEKHGITRVESTAAIKAPMVSGAKAFNDEGVISFEASEGYAPGFIGGQNGWSTYSTNTTKPIVSAANASDGEWSLELSKHDGLNTGVFVGGFSPLFSIDEDVMSISYDVFIESTGGADYDVIVQAPSQGFLTARVKFFWQGGIRLVDFNNEGTVVMLATGVPYPVNEWFDLTIEVDRGADVINYYLNGDLFWTGAIFGGTVMEQVVVLHDNWNDGEAGFIDNIRVSSEAQWLTADVTSGTVAAGESVDVTLSFNAVDFEAGEYFANLMVFTNDPSNEVVDVPVSFTLVDPVSVSSIGELFEVAEPGDGVVYRIDGEVYLTFNSTFRNRKVVVDATRGMVLDDNSRNLSQNFNRYDGITGLTGTVSAFNGLVQFTPSFDLEASSSNNLILPERVVIPDLSNAKQGSLVVIENVTFSQTGEFANQQNYTITDQDGNTFTVRTDRVVESILDEGETSYIGTTIPTGPVTVVGYITVFNNPQLVIRTLEDFFDANAVGGFSLVSPPNNATVALVPDSDDEVTISWGAASGDDVEYIWFANATGLPLMVPAHAVITEETGFTVSQGGLVDLLESLFGEVELGDTFTLDWAVFAYNGEGVRHSDQVWTVTFEIAAPPVGENVTFSVNMSYQEGLGVFQPEAGDQVFVRGSFNDWSTVAGQEMVETTPGIFEVTLFVAGEEGANHAYKYYIMAGDGRDLPNTGWEINGVGPVGGNGDRLLVLVGDDQVLDTVWFNNEEGTSTGDDVDLPLEFALKQNYPNPFNPTTQIQFALPQATEVRIDVFNVMGQRVATLVNGAQNAGYHTVTFDANRLASGVYIYRMQAGSFVQTQKMLLVK